MKILRHKKTDSVDPPLPFSRIFPSDSCPDHRPKSSPWTRRPSRPSRSHRCPRRLQGPSWAPWGLPPETLMTISSSPYPCPKIGDGF